MTTKWNLIKSLRVVGWLAELVVNGPDVYPLTTLDTLGLISLITCRWPEKFRQIVENQLG